MSIRQYTQSEILNRLRVQDREEQLERQRAQRENAQGLNTLNLINSLGNSALKGIQLGADQDEQAFQEELKLAELAGATDSQLVSSKPQTEGKAAAFNSETTPIKPEPGTASPISRLTIKPEEVKKPLVSGQFGTPIIVSENGTFEPESTVSQTAPVAQPTATPVPQPVDPKRKTNLEKEMIFVADILNKKMGDHLRQNPGSAPPVQKQTNVDLAQAKAYWAQGKFDEAQAVLDKVKNEYGINYQNEQIRNVAPPPAAEKDKTVPPATPPIFPQTQEALAAQQAAELAAAEKGVVAPAGVTKPETSQTSAAQAAIDAKKKENTQILDKYAEGLNFKEPEYTLTPQEQAKKIVQEALGNRGAGPAPTGIMAIIMGNAHSKDARRRALAEKVALKAVMDARRANRTAALEEAITRTKLSEQRGGLGGGAAGINALKANRQLETDEMLGMVYEQFGPELAQIAKMQDPEARAVALKDLISKSQAFLPKMNWTTPGILTNTLTNDLAEYGEDYRSGVASRLSGTKASGKGGSDKLVPAAELSKLSDTISATDEMSRLTNSQNPAYNKFIQALGSSDAATYFDDWIKTPDGIATDAAIRRQVALYLRSISGAAATDAEYARILQSAPNPGDKGPAFYAKLRNMVAEMDRAVQTKISTWQQGGYNVGGLASRVRTPGVQSTVDEDTKINESRKKTGDL